MDLHTTERVLRRYFIASAIEDRLLRARLERIASKVKRLLAEARSLPQRPMSSATEALADILAEAEYGDE